MKIPLFLASVLLLLFAFAGIHFSSTAHASVNQHQPRSVPAASCGVERWSVKTGTDADAGLINLQAITQTTIPSLTALPAPSTLPANNRVQPTETTVFQLHATLTKYKLEADSDYHLILNDASGNTMIGEIPAPACVGSSSPLLSGIQAARAAFDAKYSVTGSFQAANVPVTVTGVGFFDFQHGQTGVASNGVELHAVIGIQFDGSSGGGGGGSSLVNGDFEMSTLIGWTGTGSTSISTTAHTGNASGQVGSTSQTNGDSSISQTFTIPSGASSLSFWYQVSCPDTVAYDWATATLKDTTNGTTTTMLTKTCTNNATWVQASAGVTAGHTVTLTLTSHDDNYAGDPTYTLFDDVQVS